MGGGKYLCDKVLAAVVLQDRQGRPCRWPRLAAGQVSPVGQVATCRRLSELTETLAEKVRSSGHLTSHSQHKVRIRILNTETLSGHHS